MEGVAVNGGKRVNVEGFKGAPRQLNTDEGSSRAFMGAKETLSALVVVLEVQEKN